MTKNPFINALLASAYIGLVVSIMGSMDKSGTDTLLIPMAMLSLFVLSTAVMGYLFCYQPILLLSEGKRGEATKLFLQTAGVFALFTALAFGAMIL